MGHGTSLRSASVAGLQCTDRQCLTMPLPPPALVQDAIQGGLATLERQRSLDFYGQLLWQQQFRATEFMSRWIELKERGRQ
jgi:hypothetical protein